MRVLTHQDKVLLSLMLVVPTIMHLVLVFFFQAEDGIRDLTVTGVQTCALPISASLAGLLGSARYISSSSVRARRPASPPGPFSGAEASCESCSSESRPSGVPGYSDRKSVV